MKAKWEKDGFAVRLCPFAYTCTGVELREAACEAPGAELQSSSRLIGYSRRMKAIFREACHRPVILPRTLLGRAVAEFVDTLP